MSQVDTQANILYKPEYLLHFHNNSLHKTRLQQLHSFLLITWKRPYDWKQQTNKPDHSI